MKTTHRALLGAIAIGATLLATGVRADDKIKVGLMLPYSGTYAALGNAIENGF
jgi:branched-chain amino acid transport system substrate-binding protein